MEGKDSPEAPEVSVITRTKNRPIMLERALDSVSGQDYWRFEWIVVNDGGERAPVDELVEEARSRGVTANVVHRDLSIGMEAASNAGIARAVGSWLVIHDDDDSWSPDFLRRATSYLREHPRFQAVVTQSILIEELIRDDAIIETSRRIYNPGLSDIQLADLCIRNHFPPISFVFSRDVAQAVGLFDESLPVLGDWDFALRFLTAADIGCLPEPLANYHVREAVGPYANSLTANRKDHASYDSAVRLKYFRDDLEKNRQGLGHLLMSARLNTFQDAEQLQRLHGLFSANTQTQELVERLGYVANQLSAERAKFENTILHLRVAARKIPIAGRLLSFQDSDPGQPGTT
jgi:glycosyltransferase involved in cell wall biosynthesis